MHNSYFFLSQLTKQLSDKLKNGQLLACFSQNKDELMLGFTVEGEDFYIKASLLPSFCCLFFPNNFHRSRKNSVDLFKEIVGLEIIEVRQFTNERCFAFEFTQNYTLLFKMHGNRSNIILFEHGKYKSMFRNSLRQDQSIALEKLNRHINQSHDAFVASEGNYKSLFPTFGPVIKHYLQTHNYETLNIEDRWQCIQDVLQTLQSPAYHILDINDTLHFSLVKTGSVIASYKDVIEGLNNFFILYSKEGFLKKEKRTWLGILQKSLKQTTNYISKTSKKLDEINNRLNYEIQANILMANLHNIPKGVSEVELDNFYDNSKIKIKLKEHLPPQKNAELFYKKAKNQKIETDKLQEVLHAKKDQSTALNEKIAFIESCEDVKKLRAWVKAEGLVQQVHTQETPKPYHTFEYNGFEIWVGKNAKANDELTFKHTWKEDLWLHAKDVSGSHVVIKCQSNQKVPKTVIEKAAQLAGYYSKRKTDSLCPVIVTPKKFVRKRKGDPAGAVVVEKEEVILVQPEKWQ